MDLKICNELCKRAACSSNPIVVYNEVCKITVYYSSSLIVGYNMGWWELNTMEGGAAINRQLLLH